MTKRLDDLQYKGLMLYQDDEKYCFTSDSIHLANFVKTPKNAKVVDLCSGSGVIGILVFAKNHVDSVKLIEIQEDLANLSKESVLYNKLENSVEVINKPLQNISEEIGREEYDVVFCNPPYKKVDSSILNEKEEISIARHEIAVRLEEIFEEASKLLKFGGYFYVVNKEERLSDMICFGRKYNLEPKLLEIIPSKRGANVVMLQCKKGGKSGIRISIKE